MCSSDLLSLRMNLPVCGDIVERIKHRRPQARLDLKHRAANVRSAFRATTAETEYRLILVDDVVTSGATMLEVRRTLEEAGYRVVAAVSVAHGR